ncbi:hypothetical protein P775_07605 [Puniceibacterium antarcticum]|uniref:Uncharacterized protein n=1 Tax=Puniceibacterium antarcticum TaxID=1206336 RepID=A0A2G8RH25_9RHOB|nr:argininosuccinate lyase [Puniceibacterium antarcticum]PIL20830.1 hypothetical protein P775_07605 [Puniceibacterium antarcticum]
MKVVLILGVLALAGCGADGDPIAPKKPETPGVSMSVTGTANIGISG